MDEKRGTGEYVSGSFIVTATAFIPTVLKLKLWMYFLASMKLGFLHYTTAINP